MGWWYMPVYFLRDVDPMEVTEIRVHNGINEDEFVITEPGEAEGCNPKLTAAIVKDVLTWSIKGTVGK